jgi:MFS transporter, MHS family, shikimate and dehydroshikimate transport protein
MHERAVTAAAGARVNTPGQVLFASLIGTTIEFFDFYIYATAAVLAFPRLFFPTSDPASAVLASLATFGIAFLARPIGSALFGHFGDRIGRKAMLVTSLMIMGVATFLIGCLPTHASIGIAAPILLVLLRFAQGIGVGGEWGGAVLMAVESAPKGKRGLFGAFPQMGVPAGLLLSTVVFTVVQNMTSEDQFMAWGWRIPFLVSIVLVAVGLFVRLALAESPAFKEVKESKTEVDVPLVELVKTQKRDVLTAMGMRIAENGCFYIFTVFVLHYGEETLGLEKNTMLTGVIIAAGLGLLTVPFYGWLSDRFGRRKLYMAGALFTFAFVFPFFALLDTKEPVLIWLAIVLAVNIGHDLMYGPQAAYFSELFATRMRYTGASVGYQLASVFGGGFAPLIAVALLAAGGDEPYLVALYMMGMGLITVVATYYARETFKSDISDSDAHRRAPTERFVRKETADRETTGVA